MGINVFWMYQSVEHEIEGVLVFFVRVVVCETYVPQQFQETCIGQLSDLLLTHQTNEMCIVIASYGGLDAVQWGVLGQLRTFQTNAIVKRLLGDLCGQN